jgi:hypothetical protein
METLDKLEYIGKHDPEGAERLKRLLSRLDALKTGNVYGERFTERQFELVFKPLLQSLVDRAKILEALTEKAGTVPSLSGRVGIKPDEVFKQMKELMKRNLIQIAGHEGRDPVYGRKS